MPPGEVPLMTAAATRKEPVVFSQVVEALFKHAFKERLDTNTRARLKMLGIDLDQPFQVAYSVPTWFATLHLSAEVLYPGIPSEQARYRSAASWWTAMARPPWAVPCSR